jgi:effector-binding domain-containing protein
MTLKDIRIVDLPPMRVASALGYGTEPETQASILITKFAKSIGLEPGKPGYRTFGFNNPNPSPGSPNYGYEIWLVVGEDVTASDPIAIKEIPGGKYAVTQFTGLPKIGASWRALVAWFEDSAYTRPPNWCRCLEEVVNPAETDPEKWTFNLYLPIAE